MCETWTLAVFGEMNSSAPDLAVGPAARQQPQHLGLARGERPAGRAGQPRAAGAPGDPAGQRGGAGLVPAAEPVQRLDPVDGGRRPEAVGQSRAFGEGERLVRRGQAARRVPGAQPAVRQRVEHVDRLGHAEAAAAEPFQRRRVPVAVPCGRGGRGGLQPEARRAHAERGGQLSALPRQPLPLVHLPVDDQPGAEPRQDLDACRERAGDEPRGLAQVVQFVLVALLAAQLRAEDEQPRRPAGFPVAVRLLQRAPDEREPAAGIAGGPGGLRRGLQDLAAGGAGQRRRVRNPVPEVEDAFQQRQPLGVGGGRAPLPGVSLSSGRRSTASA